MQICYTYEDKKLKILKSKFIYEMGPKITVSLLFHVLIVSIRFTDALNCYTTGNFTANSTYAENRDLVLYSLASNVTANGGFYNTTIGFSNDTVYGLVLCMSDPSAEDCSSCVNSAIQDLIGACPNQKEAISWGGDPVPCIVHYANRYFFGSLKLSPFEAGYNTGKLETNLTQFGQIWSGLMADTVTKASMGSSRLKLGTGKADLTSTQKIYVFMQCTPDISHSDCSYCLQESVAYFKSCCYGQQGGYVQKPNCVLRWDLYPFFNLFPEVPSPSPSPPFLISSPSPTNATIKKGKKGKASRTVIVTVIPTVIFLAVVILCTFTFFHFRKSKKEVRTDETESVESLQFAFSAIRVATEDFSEQNKLGQGGFGPVYKGTLPSGQEIAVKRLSHNSGQGDLEFKNEVLLVAKLQHRSLVRLLGFCLQGTERLLIYEFVPNASLDHFIFDPIKRVHLNWETRYKIIGGIARGVLYLHEDSRLRIIHRDLKASNILLDEKMNPKISDFGTARLFVVDQSQGNTRRIVGTYGYMAPEYAMQGQFSVKSDVFSFGVLVLEIVSGRKNSFCNGDNIEHLMSYAWKHWKEGTALELIDPILRSGPTTEMIRCIHIGLLCVQENAADRPTMASVVLMLSSSSLTMQKPSKPAFFMRSSTYQSDMSSSRVTQSSQSEIEAIPLSRNEASITELYPR